MTTTEYYTATTLDGYIADQDNSLQWLFDLPRGDGSGHESRWDAFIDRVGAMVMGATTYLWVLDFENALENAESWQKFYGDRTCWVVTHRDLPKIPGADIRLTQGDMAAAHPQMMESAGGKTLWLVGGGDLVGQFADAGLLDRIHLGVAPVTLGGGAPLLPRRLTGRLTLSEAADDGVMVYLTYDVAPRGA